MAKNEFLQKRTHPDHFPRHETSNNRQRPAISREIIAPQPGVYGIASNYLGVHT